MVYQYKYPRPAVTTDCVVLVPSQTGGGREILLIERAHDPFKGCWALPGGFLEMEEELSQGAARELEEETGLVLQSSQLVQLGAYGRVARDPRGRTISVVFGVVLDSKPQRLQAASDALKLQWFQVDELPSLAFDHAEIVADAFKFFATRNGF